MMCRWGLSISGHFKIAIDVWSVNIPWPQPPTLFDSQPITSISQANVTQPTIQVLNSQSLSLTRQVHDSQPVTPTRRVFDSQPITPTRQIIDSQPVTPTRQTSKKVLSTKRSKLPIKITSSFPKRSQLMTNSHQIVNTVQYSSQPTCHQTSNSI